MKAFHGVLLVAIFLRGEYLATIFAGAQSPLSLIFLQGWRLLTLPIIFFNKSEQGNSVAEEKMRKLDQCPRVKINAQYCVCTYPGCSRRGLCCECMHYHRQRNELPACYFTADEEKTYNRSIEFFIQRRTGK